MPFDVIHLIATHMDSAVEVGKMRLASKDFCCAAYTPFMKLIGEGRTIYPRYDCFGKFLSLLAANPKLGVHVRNITLVSEGLREHEYRSMWAWEFLEDKLDLPKFSVEDTDIINEVNYLHAEEAVDNAAFLNTGGYRTMLTRLLSRLPRLETITIRKLRQGEHTPGWTGPNLLQGLSFYRPDLDTNDIYYGDWKYDSLHNRITEYIDEFGEEFKEEDAGPQASFQEDFDAAFLASGTMATVVEV